MYYMYQISLMQWTAFRVTDPLRGESIRPPVVFHHKGPVARALMIYFLLA